MTKFEESLVEFIKSHRSISCLLDIDGTGEEVEVDFFMLMNIGENDFKYYIQFHQSKYEYRDSDYSYDALEYMNHHWIRGVSKLKVQTYADVELNDSELPAPSVNLPLTPKLFNELRNINLTDDEQKQLDGVLTDFMKVVKNMRKVNQ